jgi:sugar phosphate isomerase/epimerase
MSDKIQGKKNMIKSDYSRRDFIRMMALGGTILTIPGCRIFQKENYAAKIGIQLYTVRTAIEKDFDTTIRRIADMGYLGVETYFLPEYILLAAAASSLREVGLEVLGCHCNLPIGDDRDMTLKMAETYQSNRMIYHGWPQDDKYKDLDAIKSTVELYNEISLSLKAEGLRFGLHNHWWEFEKAESYYPFYYLLENLNPDIFFEIDVYWAKTGGQDPVKVVSDFASRAPLLHIKDGPAQKGELAYQQVPAGAGTVDFPGIVKAGGTNTEWMIVEFDEYENDIFDGIQQSYHYLTNNKLARGRK